MFFKFLNLVLSFSLFDNFLFSERFSGNFKDFSDSKFLKLLLPERSNLISFKFVKSNFIKFKILFFSVSLRFSSNFIVFLILSKSGKLFFLLSKLGIIWKI